MCCLTGQYHSGTVGCTLWLALSKQIKFFSFCDNNIILTPPPAPPPLHTEIVVQFYRWSKFYFLLFQTHYQTLPYPKTYLPWQEPTSVVDSGDSLFLTSPLSPTVNSPNNPTTGRRNILSHWTTSSRCFVLLTSVHLKKNEKKNWKKRKLKSLKRKLG